MKMRILTVFTQPVENNTSSMIRCRNVINGLAEIGNEVVAYSPYPDMNSIYYSEYFELNSNIEVRRYGKKSGLVNQGNKKDDNLAVKLMLNIYRKFDLFGSAVKYIRYTDSIIGKLEKDGFDILLSFSGPMVSHIMSNRIFSNLNGVKYIQQWGDPLVNDITKNTLTPRWICKKIEKKLLCKADRIFYVSPLTKQEQGQLYPEFKDKMDFSPTPAKERVFANKKNSRIKVGYFGSYHTCARNIMPLYEAACECDFADFFIVGDSDIILEKRKNIHLMERKSLEEIDKMIDETDILICLLNLRGSQIPGKIYNYACTNKEVLLITDGDQMENIQKYFEKYNRFTFVRNIKDEIIETLQLYVSSGIPERKAVSDFFPETIAKKIIGE